jgi:hypothetical protein
VPTLVTTNIRASKLTVKDDATPPIDPAKRSLRFKSATYKGSASGVITPAVGSSSDPTSGGSTGGGATLTVYDPDIDDEVVIPLPAANWTVSGSVGRESYKYRTTTGTIATIKLGRGKLTLKLKGAGSYGLANAPHGTLAVRLRLGTGVEFCGRAPAKFPPASYDTTSKFIGISNSSAPAVCPSVP